eukprot:160503_1
MTLSLSICVIVFVLNIVTAQPSNLTCSAGTVCQIDCDQQSCPHNIINGTLATSFTLNCPYRACINSTILCPTGDSTSCIIHCDYGSACQYASVQGGVNNTMDTFSLRCTGSSAPCEYIDVSIHSLSIADVSITCTAQSGCWKSVFNIASIITNDFSLTCLTYSCKWTNFTLRSVGNNFLWDCKRSDACRESVMRFTGSSAIHTFTWICSMTTAQAYPSTCYDAILKFEANSLIDSFALECPFARSCLQTDVGIANVIINDFKLNCSGLSSLYGEGCKSLRIDTVNVNRSVNIYATEWAAMQYATIKLVSLQPDIHFRIDCAHPYRAGSATGACSEATFEIHGYIDSIHTEPTNNLTLLCDETSDCYKIYLYAYDLNYVDVDCNGQRSCSYAHIDPEYSTSLDLHCGGQYSCEQSYVNCPALNEHACTIDCAAATESCYQMDLDVQDAYMYNYLRFTCPDGDTYSNDYDNPCYGWTFNCDTGYKYSKRPHKTDATITWNSTAGEYQCDVVGTTSCCPYYEGNSFICPSGSDCNIDCGTMNCNSTFIDAQLANYLNINCSATECVDSVFYCPIGGCSMYCVGSNACQGTSLSYYGELKDNGIIHVHCEQYYACKDLFINADYVDEIEVTCTSRGSVYRDYTCGGTGVSATYANTVTINANEEFSVNSALFWVRNAVSVVVNARGKFPFNDGETYIWAEEAGSMVMNLAQRWSTTTQDGSHYQRFYIPENTIFNCFGFGCFALNFDLFRGHNGLISDGLQINIESCGYCDDGCVGELEIKCPISTGCYCNSDYIFRDDVCYNSWTTNDCGCYDVQDNMQFTVSYTDANCYPIRTVIPCAVGVPCNVECSLTAANDCTNKVINATGASALTVDCVDHYYCTNAAFLCPDSGCTINCGAYACHNSKIVYDGVWSDHGVVSLTCNGDSACYEMVVRANDVDQVNLICNDVNSTSDEAVCGLQLYANHAHTVTMDMNEHYASKSSVYYVESATHVSVSASGNDAIYQSTLYARNATFVEFNFASDAGQWATRGCRWYIPQNTTFHCFGTGCYYLGTLYMTSAVTATSPGPIVRVDGCGQCTSFTQCIRQFMMYCDPTDNYIYDYYYSSSNPQCDVNRQPYVCGCQQLIINSTYGLTYNNPACYTPWTTATPTAPTISPSATPTIATVDPSYAPTAYPSTSPLTNAPTSGAPTLFPSRTPTEAPTESPSTSPPTDTPTGSPTTSNPTDAPTQTPTIALPTNATTTGPPTTTNNPTMNPTEAPTTFHPTTSPISARPTTTKAPSAVAEHTVVMVTESTEDARQSDMSVRSVTNTMIVYVFIFFVV